MKPPVSLSLVMVGVLVVLFMALAIVGGRNLHVSATAGVTGDDVTCTPTPTPPTPNGVTPRPTRTPKGATQFPFGTGGVHAELAEFCVTPSPTPSASPTASPSPSPSPSITPVGGPVTPRPTRTPKGTLAS